MDRDKLIAKKYKAGASYKEIHQEFGISNELIKKILLEQGLTEKDLINRRNKKPQVSEELMVKLLRVRMETGLSWREIAKQWGLTLHNLYHTRKRMIATGKMAVLEKKAAALENGEVYEEPVIIENDRRSPACKQVKTCWDSRCYLHRQCPAFAAWEARKRKADPPSVGYYRKS